MRRFAFAMLAIALLVVAYDHFNAPKPQLLSAPVHVYSEGFQRICAEDMRDDAYQTKITVSTGRLERIDQWFQRVGGWRGNPVIGGVNEQCLMYTAPAVSQETSMQISVWQGNKKTDQAEVTLTPSPF